MGNLQSGAPNSMFDMMQALGLNGEEFNDSPPAITGSQISSCMMERALKSLPEDAAQR